MSILGEQPEDEQPWDDDGCADHRGLRLPSGGRVLETTGESAASIGRDVVVLDWAADPETATRVSIAASPGARPETLAQAIGLLQAAGLAVSVVDDTPGLVVARTVSMLVNEAADVVHRGEASAADVDIACAWARAIRAARSTGATRSGHRVWRWCCAPSAKRCRPGATGSAAASRSRRSGERRSMADDEPSARGWPRRGRCGRPTSRAPGSGWSSWRSTSGGLSVRMTVTEAMVNGHAIAHGGFVFALADSAFALACNSHGPVTVAAGCDITFVAPARLGDVLVAEAVERAVFGRSGLTDVSVRVESSGALVAELRGRSRTVGSTS